MTLKGVSKPMNVQHIEVSLAKIRAIYERASARIEALKPGEKVPATELAADLAHDVIQPDGKPMTGPQLYPTLKFLFDGYPGVAVRKGAHGGIIKLDPNAVATPAVVPATDDAEDVNP
jgi:hypothetical protein